MQKMYRCPFCEVLIVDSIDSMVEHREPGGACDQNMASEEPT